MQHIKAGPFSSFANRLAQLRDGHSGLGGSGGGWGWGAGQEMGPVIFRDSVPQCAHTHTHRANTHTRSLFSFVFCFFFFAAAVGCCCCCFHPPAPKLLTPPLPPHTTPLHLQCESALHCVGKCEVCTLLIPVISGLRGAF